MNLREVFVLLACVAFSLAQHPGAVRVTVYYETMSEDSRAFIVDQLKPTFDVLAPKFMQVEFVPYGKARDFASDESKGPIRYTFHNAGFREQYEGNKLHACALVSLAHLGDSRRVVNLVSCALANPDRAADAYGPCFEGLTNVTKGQIDSCVKSDYGDRLLSHHGRTTHALMPPIRQHPEQGKIPRIVFDGVYDAYDEIVATMDLKKMICRKFRKSDKRKCKRTPPPKKTIYPTQSFQHANQAHP